MAKEPKGSENERERDPLLDAIGQRIKAARGQAGLHQKQLAAAIGTSQMWVFLVEDGQQNLTVQSLRRVAEALHVSVRSLIPDEAEPEARDAHSSQTTES